MPAIIAYTYESAAHCIDCTAQALRLGGFTWHATLGIEDAEHCDENGIPINAWAWDSEGNEVRPIFATDETCADLPLDAGGCDLVCDTCSDVIKRHYAKE